MADSSKIVEEYTKVESRRGLSVTSGASHMKLFDPRVLAMGKGEYGRLWSVVTLGLLISFSYIVQGIIIALILEDVFSGRPMAGSIPSFAGLVLIIALRWAMIWANDRIVARAATNIAISLRRRIYHKLYDLGPGWMLSQKSGVVQATIVDGAEALQNYYGRFLPQVIVSSLAGLAIMVILLYVDVIIGLVVGVMMVASLLQPLAIYRGVGSRIRVWFVAMPRLFAEYVDNVQGIVTLKSFNAGKRHGKLLDLKTNALYDAEIGILKDEILWGVPLGLVAAIGGTVAIVIGALRMDAGSLSAGGLLFVLLLVREALRPVTDLRQTIHFSFAGMGAAEGVLDILEAVPPAAAPVDPIAPGTLPPSIAFEGVTFRYRKGDAPAVDNFSFAVQPGEKVALVGRSGSGKTTVTSLLLRFFDPDEGAIRLGGEDIRRIRPERLRAMYSVVSQDTYLFHGTVRDNLLLAKPGASREELESATRAASAHDFITGLPKGYDTVVGERGVKLSGGERQRIAIARAILKGAPILVLDEATSNVDVANESLIRDALDRVARDRTTIIISHRLSAVRDADRIYVIEKGRLAESGSHSDLIRRNGDYHALLMAEGGSV
ncbi:putative multidrug export ATP-binding/permease protein [Methanoculleus chikugoensis]|uniref:Putative multidrug export ATP-binding/permease protein n=1 Tax=Methanoculleus chikugoensis TaxID=118126 RepID=A0A1M4MHJ7_9EURY|nr:ABC transporter ATP-binding protein [Methanoculleus chikugoensis]SCL74367.1 putative multidrug export ATP-binding/permease protein [Methanoculleus chikugoensis]